MYSVYHCYFERYAFFSKIWGLIGILNSTVCNFLWFSIIRRGNSKFSPNLLAQIVESKSQLQIHLDRHLFHNSIFSQSNSLPSPLNNISLSSLSARNHFFFQNANHTLFYKFCIICMLITHAKYKIRQNKRISTK